MYTRLEESDRQTKTARTISVLKKNTKKEKEIEKAKITASFGHYHVITTKIKPPDATHALVYSSRHTLTLRAKSALLNLV